MLYLTKDWNKNKIMKLLSTQSGEWLETFSVDEDEFIKIVFDNQEIDIGSGFTAKIINTDWYNVDEFIIGKIIYKIQADLKLVKK